MVKVKNRQPRKKGKTPPRVVQLANTNAVIVDPDADVTPIIEFIESFRQMVDPNAQKPSQLISIKIPIPLLKAFKYRAKLEAIPYQTLIKRIMLEYLRTMPKI